MDDIFISYASQDRERARQLAAALEARGWSVWWDREIPLGRSYDEVIEQALAGARCMLVLWSAAAAASEWVRSEASEGKRRGILVPVFLEEVDAPLAFRLLNGARLEHWQPEQANAEFERLAQRVGELLALPATAVTSPRSAAPGAAWPEPRATGQRPPWKSPYVVAAALLVLLIGGAVWWFATRPSPQSAPAAVVVPAAPAPETGAAQTPTSAAPDDALPDLASALKSLGDLSGAGLFGAGNLALRAFRVPALGLNLVYVTPVQSQQSGGVLPQGAVVWEVSAGVAQQAGVQALDRVDAIDGKRIRNDHDLRRAIMGMGPGRHTLRILREGAAKTLTLDCPTCESATAAPTRAAVDPAKPKATTPAKRVTRKPAPVVEPAAPKPTPAARTASEAPPAPVAKPVRPTLVYAALGLPISRSFWSGETRASYTPKLSAALQQAGRDVLRVDTRDLQLDAAGFNAWWDESGQRRSRELCAASPAPIALLSARVETPFVTSSIESAYWPELSLRLYLCARHRLYRYQKTLSPLNQDTWPFSTELNSETEKFLRLYRDDLTE